MLIIYLFLVFVVIYALAAWDMKRMKKRRYDEFFGYPGEGGGVEKAILQKLDDDTWAIIKGSDGNHD